VPVLQGIVEEPDVGRLFVAHAPSSREMDGHY
jgi:hypothetical protein